MQRSRSAIRALIVGAVGVICIATIASAHDTWLLPDSTSVPVGANVRLSMTSGMSFPKNETGIDTARLEGASVRLAGKTSALKPIESPKTALRLETTLRKAGVASIWVRLKPRTLELTPKQVTEYLDEIGAPDSVRRLYSGSGQVPRWRERYTKYAKTFVAVGASTTDASWREPVGIGLEIVPVVNPTKLTAGDTLTIRVLRDGAPAGGFPIGDAFAAETSSRLVKTDANGVAKLLARRGGRWMLRGTDLRRPASDVAVDWESSFSTLTLNVAPRRSR